MLGYWTLLNDFNSKTLLSKCLNGLTIPVFKNEIINKIIKTSNKKLKIVSI